VCTKLKPKRNYIVHIQSYFEILFNAFPAGFGLIFSHSACLGDPSLAACVERKFFLLPHRLGTRLVLIGARVDKLN